MNTSNWLIMSKQQGDVEDYRVLAGSVSNDLHWDAKLKGWMTGEVPLEGNWIDPGTPWFQFPVEALDGMLTQVVMRQDWTDYYDASGRPVLNTICLLLPFEILVKHPCGFTHLAGLFEQPSVKDGLARYCDEVKRGLGEFDQPPLEVTLPAPVDVAEYFKKVGSEVGLDFARLVAGHLVSGRLVTLVEGSEAPLPWERKLEVLDAAMTALPYGTRADCSAAMWLSPLSSSKVRISFGRERDPERVCVFPGDTTVPEPMERGYAGDVRILKAHFTESSELIAKLLQETNPISLESLNLKPSAVSENVPEIQMRTIIRNETNSISRKQVEIALSFLDKDEDSMLSVQEIQALIRKTFQYLNLTHVPKVIKCWSSDFEDQVVSLSQSPDPEKLGVAGGLLSQIGNERKYSDTLTNLYRGFVLNKTDTGLLDRFAMLLDKTCNDEMEKRPKIALFAIKRALELIHQTWSQGGRPFFYNWIRIVLATGNRYQTPFFDRLLSLAQYNPDIRRLLAYWNMPQRYRVEANLGLSDLLILIRMAVIRGQDYRLAIDLLNQILRTDHVWRVKGEGQDYLKRFLVPSDWKSLPLPGRLGATLDVINSLLYERWTRISTLTDNQQEEGAYQAEVNTYKKRYPDLFEQQDNTAVSQANPELEEPGKDKELTREDPDHSPVEATLAKQPDENKQEAVALPPSGDDPLGPFSTALSEQKSLEETAEILAKILVEKGRFDNSAIWNQVSEMMGEFKYPGNASSLLRFLLAVQSEIEEDNFRKLVMQNLLPEIQKTEGILPDQDAKDDFFQLYSLFIYDNIVGYVNAYKPGGGETFREWQTTFRKFLASEL